jgi:hypothetical protein
VFERLDVIDDIARAASVRLSGRWTRMAPAERLLRMRIAGNLRVRIALDPRISTCGRVSREATVGTA